MTWPLGRLCQLSTPHRPALSSLGLLCRLSRVGVAPLMRGRHHCVLHDSVSQCQLRWLRAALSIPPAVRRYLPHRSYCATRLPQQPAPQSGEQRTVWVSVALSLAWSRGTQRDLLEDLRSVPDQPSVHRGAAPQRRSRVEAHFCPSPLAEDGSPESFSSTCSGRLTPGRLSDLQCSDGPTEETSLFRQRP